MSDKEKHIATESDFSGAELAGELQANLAAERKEVRSQGFEVLVDRQKLAELDGIPDHMMEWLSKLPETLHFNEQITLIVGENGSGKTQFARALTEVLKRNREDFDGRVHGLVLRDEPSAEIPKALSLSMPRKGNYFAAFVEASSIMHEGREWVTQQQRLDPSKRSTELDFRLSARQAFEIGVEAEKRMLTGNIKHMLSKTEDPKFPAEGGDGVVIFDEPEMGLSPERQLGLEGILKDFADENTLFVPTNNLALYLSDMPRLDLSKPERGVHRPSEYGEGGKIELNRPVEQID
jgi:predicted ATPase